MSAADRLRREGPSVHHILCDLRRPPVGTPKCTCKVPEVAARLADLLEALARDHSSEAEHARIALEQAIERSQP